MQFQTGRTVIPMNQTVFRIFKVTAVPDEPEKIKKDTPPKDIHCHYTVDADAPEGDPLTRFGSLRIGMSRNIAWIVDQFKKAGRPDAAERVSRELLPGKSVQIEMSLKDVRRWNGEENYRPQGDVLYEFKYEGGVKKGTYPYGVPDDGDILEASLIGEKGQMKANGKTLNWSAEKKETILHFIRP
jgi:hypothetical protein